VAEHSISVLIPVFNGARFIAAALESVAAQTLATYETIVVDDGSTDGSGDVAARFPFVRVIHQENRGAGAARNRAVAEARGDHFAFLDADDLWKPAKLARQMAALAARPETGWVICRQEYLLDEGVPRPGWVAKAELAGNYVSWVPSATVVRRECFERVGNYDEVLRFGEDLEWLARARDAGFAGTVVDDLLFTRRVHRTNLMHEHKDGDLQRAIAKIMFRRRNERAASRGQGAASPGGGSAAPPSGGSRPEDGCPT
jgi:glycosyltransferase involved in cell wall biosynthesis